MRTKAFLRSFGWSSVMVLLAAGCLLSTALKADADSASPWWDEFPTFIQDDDPAAAVAHNATVSLNGAFFAPSWGTYFTMVEYYHPELTAEFAAQGVKSIGWFETFGEFACFVVEFGPIDEGLNVPLNHHWSWDAYSGGGIEWIGAQNFFDAPPFARPYTRMHPTYGGDPMTFPDGTVATGYDGDPADPRNSRVVKAGCSMNVLGVVYASANEDEARSGPPYDGCLLIDGKYYSSIGFSKDSPCPHWLDLDMASAKLGAGQGMNGIWADNFSAWDSLSSRPVDKAFGEWSVAGFRTYLSENFTPAELPALGVTDLNTFDVRTAIRAKAQAWGGDDTNTEDPVWESAAWRDDPLWHAYCIHKRQRGTQALSNFYNGVKAAAAEAGQDDFLVCGNDTPAFSLGWLRGSLDMVSTEYSPGWSLDGGPRGLTLPPAGRQAPRYKLAREHAQSRFVNVWLYLEGDYDQYGRNAGLVNTLQYEMLATHTLPMAYPNDPIVGGTEAIHSAYFGFIQSARETFGERVPVEEVGIYYSSSSILAFMTPGGFLDHANQPHQFAVYGWGTALGELHYQYRMVPEWKLTSDNLADLRVLVIPNAEVFDPSDVTNVLEPWVQAGGLLIVTGDSGERLGESGNFDTNSAGLSLAPLTGVSSMTPAPSEALVSVGAGKVLYLPGNIGMEYYNEIASRPTLLEGFSAAMNQLLADEDDLLVRASGVSTTVGLTMYRDEAAGRQFVDINNMDLDLATDVVTPTGTLTVDVALPEWLNAGTTGVSALSPEGEVPVWVAKSGAGRVTLNVGSVTHYASVVLEVFDTDGDGLTDEQETMDLEPETPGVQNPFDPNDPDTTGDNGVLGADGIPDGQNDWDGDGVSNETEFGSGWNPADPLDPGAMPVAGGFGLLALGLLLLWAFARRRRAEYYAGLA